MIDCVGEHPVRWTHSIVRGKCQTRYGSRHCRHWYSIAGRRACLSLYNSRLMGKKQPAGKFVEMVFSACAAAVLLAVEAASDLLLFRVLTSSCSPVRAAFAQGRCEPLFCQFQL